MLDMVPHRAFGTSDLSGDGRLRWPRFGPVGVRVQRVDDEDIARQARGDLTLEDLVGQSAGHLRRRPPEPVVELLCRLPRPGFEDATDLIRLEAIDALTDELPIGVPTVHANDSHQALRDGLAMSNGMPRSRAAAAWPKMA